MVYDGLTPDVVANKRFTPVRGNRDGYDMEEVDLFLDEVERSINILTLGYNGKVAELHQCEARVLEANERVDALTQELDAEKKAAEVRESEVRAQANEIISDMEAEHNARVVELEARIAELEEREASAEAPQGTGLEVAPVEAEAGEGEEEVRVTPVLPTEVVVRTDGEASSAAARLLESAMQTARMTTESAEADAETLRAEVREESERLRQETADKIAAAQDELAAHRAEQLDAITEEKTVIAGEVETLKAFESELRSGLTSYLSQLQEQVAQPLSFTTEEANETPEADEASATED